MEFRGQVLNRAEFIIQDLTPFCDPFLRGVTYPCLQEHFYILYNEGESDFLKRENMSKGWKIYWVIVAVTITNYLTMVLWSLPLVSEMARGGVPFDMRPGGYSLEDARVFLAVINNEGRDFYLNTQQLLDFFYPTLFAITVAIPLVHLVPRYWGWTLALLAIAAGVFDYLENSAVGIMLRVEPDLVTEAMVSSANNWTLAKSISTTIASIALLVVLCIKAIAWLQSFRVRS